VASTWGSSWGTSWGLSWEHRAAPLARPTTWHDPGHHQYGSEEEWKKQQIQLLHPWERKQPSKSIPQPIIELPPEVREEDEINEIVHMLSWLEENGYLDDDDD
jgi:hypothetical protein